ncbi:MAG TPA: hypothetical protein VFF13_04795 [archaeon]|nr:hypothetical protein [archaeon]
MKPRYSILLTIFVLSLNFSFAEFEQQDEPSQGFNVPGGFDLGLPESSAADPEYIAQEKFVDEMTTVYTWIAANSTQFVSGCRENREQLVTTINSVIQQAQETSTVCKLFEAEAAACDPDLFCSRFEHGMPIPPGMESAFREAGLDPETVSVNDMTQDVAIKICKAQSGKEFERQKERNEKMKDNLKSQIPAFRQKCEEFEKMMEQGRQGPTLPDFQFGMPQQGDYGPQQGQQYGPPQGDYGPPIGDHGPQTGDYGPPAGDYGPPTGDYGPPTGQPYDQPPEQQPFQQPQETIQQPQEVSQPTTETTPTPEPAPAPEPTPEVTTSPQPNVLNAITGFAFILAFEEEPAQTIPQDYSAPPEEFVPPQDYSQPPQDYQQGYPPQEYDQGYRSPMQGDNYGFDRISEGTMPHQGQPFGTPENYRPPQGDSSYNEEGFNRERQFGDRQEGFGSQQNNGPQQGGPHMGPSPEELCEMSDDELVDSFIGNMDKFAPQEREIDAMCTRESSKILRELNGLKLGIAKCKANAAIDCAAKQESVKSCNEIKENPETISKILVNTMCRRFGIRADATEARGGLYDVATEFYDDDPALANQLGDTADKTTEERNKLGFFNYILGDSEYGGNLQERAEKLRGVRERLATEGDADPQSISQIDDEIEKLETEGQQFTNVFDIGRIGRMFGSKE